MRIEVSRISNRINENDVLQYIDHNFEKIATEWFKFQLEWNSSAYTPFKDYEKYLILIYLINKILDFYSMHFIKMNYDEFYSKDKIEIDHFNIIDISKDLKIAKETARRKVIELEKAGVILRLKKKLNIYNVIKRKAFSLYNKNFQCNYNLVFRVIEYFCCLEVLKLLWQDTFFSLPQ